MRGSAQLVKKASCFDSLLYSFLNLHFKKSDYVQSPDSQVL